MISVRLERFSFVFICINSFFIFVCLVFVFLPFPFRSSVFRLSHDIISFLIKCRFINAYTRMHFNLWNRSPLHRHYYIPSLFHIIRLFLVTTVNCHRRATKTNVNYSLNFVLQEILDRVSHDICCRAKQRKRNQRDKRREASEKASE